MPRISEKNINIAWFTAGGAFLAYGVFIALVTKNPHFFSPFAIGLTALLYRTHFLLTRRNIFRAWHSEQWLRYIALLILASITIDQIGIALGYWNYPHYATATDELLKYLFEYATPFIAFLYAYLIGEHLFRKRLHDRRLAAAIALAIAPPALLAFTEFFNASAESWRVTLAPWIWFTVGAWLITLVPLALYVLVDRTLTEPT